MPPVPRMCVSVQAGEPEASPLRQEQELSFRLRPAIPRFPGDRETPNRRQSPRSKPPTRSPPLPPHAAPPCCWAVGELELQAAERERGAPAGEPQSARHPKLAGAAGPPTLAGCPSPGAPTVLASGSSWASHEELTPRSPNPGEPATVPSSAAAAAGAAWSSWGSCSAS
ncbi:uncharacterized protein LOC133045581 [Dama dama]|uniref:uncharacterized protein LOC133045581 n=1 Tax=Dama dama TaxID=30532 RepID=UPI002A35CF5E|nr:uncharacterized protein LOC133045581 [Dama dama]